MSTEDKEKIKFSLIKERVPTRKKGSKFDVILDEFSKSDMKSVRVDTDLNLKTLSLGLRSRIKNRKITNIKVKERESKVYLVKS